MSTLDPNELRSIRELVEQYDQYRAECREAERETVVRKVREPAPPVLPVLVTAADLADDVVNGFADGCVMITEAAIERERAAERAYVNRQFEQMLRPLQAELVPGIRLE